MYFFQYGLNELKLRFRTNLTQHLYDKYLRYVGFDKNALNWTQHLHKIETFKTQLHFITNNRQNLESCYHVKGCGIMW